MDQVALLNDTTGVMMSCAYSDPDIMVGMILGTGSNACYMESMDKVAKFDSDEKTKGPNQVIINTEWGAFGDKSELEHVSTPYDIIVDKESLYPGKQM